MGDVPTLERQVLALEDERNTHHATIDWQFTNQQARVKLKKLAIRLSKPNWTER